MSMPLRPKLAFALSSCTIDNNCFDKFNNISVSIFHTAARLFLPVVLFRSLWTRLPGPKSDYLLSHRCNKTWDYAITPRRDILKAAPDDIIISTSSQLTNGLLLGGLRFPHTMALVCKHWRNVVFSSPGLWTRIFNFRTSIIELSVGEDGQLYSRFDRIRLLQ